MNNILTAPVGLNKTIQDIQTDLYEQLPNFWSGTIEGYGKVERRMLNNGEDQPEYFNQSKTFVPEWYNATKGDYEDVYYNDDNAGQFCFLVEERDTALDEQTFICPAKIAFWVDLSKIYPGSTERIVSKAHKDVMQVLRNYNYERYKVKGLERGMDIVFRQFQTKDMRFDDMHPLYCFAINVEIEYFLTDNC